jgi:hypothetical protein
MRTPVTVPVLVGALFGALSTRLPVGDSDVFWHLTLGQATLANGIQRIDRYSWTVAGQPVSVDQWLGQVALAAAWQLGEWRGVVGLRAAAVALLVGLVVYAALREKPARPLGAVLAALPAIVLSRFVWTERPELFGFVCFAALIVLLRASRVSDRPLYLIPVLMVLWANVHGSFALGAGLVGLVAVVGFVTEPRRRRSYVLVAAATLLATLVTPAGLGAWTAPGFHLLHPPREIQEWSVPDVTTLPGALFAAALFATLATALVARTRTPREAVVLVPVLFVALIATRQLPFFPIAAAPYLAAFGGETVTWIAGAIGRVRLPRLSSAGRPPGVTADRFATGAAAVILAVAMATGTNTSDSAGYPVAALPLINTGPGLFNQYDWGGYLIASAPRTPVFIDGRLTPYLDHLDPVLAEYTTVIGIHPGWRDVIARRGIRQLLVRPTDPVAVRARDLGWPIRAASDAYVLIDVP